MLSLLERMCSQSDKLSELKSEFWNMTKTSTKFKKKRHEQKGMILVIALMVSFVMVIIAVPFLFKLSGQYRISEKSYKSLAALNLAEAGVERAIWELNYGDILSWGESSPWTMAIPDFQASGGTVVGNIEVSVTDPGDDTLIVEGTGRVPYISSMTVNRSIRVVLEREAFYPFVFAIFADDWIVLREGAYVDSYNSEDGPYGGDNTGSNGDIGTNNRSGREAESILIKENDSLVEGNAKSMLASEDDDINEVIKEGEGGEITGDKLPMEEEKFVPPVTVPTGLTYYGELTLEEEAQTISASGEYSSISLKVTTLTFDSDVSIVVTGDFSMNDVSHIVIENDAQVTFYVGGKIDIAGGSSVNATGDNPKPANFRLNYTGGDVDGAEVRLREFSDFYGIIWAPAADIDIAEGEDPDAVISGAVVGRSIEIREGRYFHYDEDLKNIKETSTSSPYIVKSWQEKK